MPERNRRTDRCLRIDDAEDTGKDPAGNRLSHTTRQAKMRYAKEAARAVRDWTFTHTPFLRVYSYMKDTNTPSRKTAVAWGARQVHTFQDQTNGTTVVYAMTKEEWQRAGSPETG